jgi:hypothetical protein
MLHIRFSKSKNPAGAGFFFDVLIDSDLHGNPARIFHPGSAQVAKGDGCR